MRLDHGHLIRAECRGFAEECINLINWINCSRGSTSTGTVTTTSVTCVGFLLGELLIVCCRFLLLWVLTLVGNRRDGLVSKGVYPHFLQLLLDVGVPVVLDLIVSSPREMSCNLRPPTCKETN